MSIEPISITCFTGDGVELSAIEQSLYGRMDVVRQAMNAGIRRFVSSHSELLSGRVLDYGAGKPGTCRTPQPFRSLLWGCTDYRPWEPGDRDLLDAPGQFDAILCTQVVQNVEHLYDLFESFHFCLKPGGHLILTYPVAWEEFESASEPEYWRITKHGAWLLAHNFFTILEHYPLAQLKIDGCLNLVLANGLVARK